MATFIPNKKQYDELTKPEKMLVGYIYDLYFQWMKDSHLPGTPVYLKNSLFSDFLYSIKIEEDLKYYADYLYLCDYKDENLIVNEEYRSIVPKSPITLTKEKLDEKIEQLNSRTKEENKGFFKKLFC